MLLITQAQGSYLVRWPSWVGALVALSVFAALYCVLAVFLRRRWGTVGLGLAVLVASGLMVGTAWSEGLQLATAVARVGLWSSMAALTVIACLVPTAIIERVERSAPTPRFGRTVLLGVASAYVALAVGAVTVVVAALLVRLWRATVA